MLQQNSVVGSRIKRIVADATLSDDEFNYVDFICLLDNGIAFQLPYVDDDGMSFENAIPSANHQPVAFPKSKWWHYYRRLWWSPIRDVLIPADPDFRIPDSSRILLESGWSLTQCAGTPIGILPSIDIMPDTSFDDTMVSIWDVDR